VNQTHPVGRQPVIRAEKRFVTCHLQMYMQKPGGKRVINRVFLLGYSECVDKGLREGLTHTVFDECCTNSGLWRRLSSSQAGSKAAARHERGLPLLSHTAHQRLT
jgi:hypothetical protein